MAWSDFCDYVTHFTKPLSGRSEYVNMLSICGHQVLNAVNPFGIVRSRAPVPDSQLTVCFSEIPLHCLDRIAQRRSRSGIGFTKDFARSKGAQPIWYVEKDGLQHQSLETLISTARSRPSPADDPIWKLTPFIDVAGDFPTGKYRFEWEREWRCVGNFRFTEKDVAFLILPEKDHVAACEFFREAQAENIGPSYSCPYIDSSWDEEKIGLALAHNWPHCSM